MAAYYNEFDPYAAQWLRNLISAGHIADGEVDERDIRDIQPLDLIGFDQCHFFAGLGGWSYALRLAGWPGDRPVWTGSCPCQPFSAAGKGDGFADERHLWPAWFHLIEQCEPGVVFGEQVEAAIKHGWLDLVQTDLEGIGYAFGAVGIPAAGVGAFHIRQRLWFVGERMDDSASARRHGARKGTENEARYETRVRGLEYGRSTGQLADSDGGNPGAERQQPSGEQRLLAESGGFGELGDTKRTGLAQQRSERGIPYEAAGTDARETAERADASTFWSAADWLACRDGKARPVEPGTFPLAHGIPARVGRLRAYGNAIVPQVAAEVVRAYIECQP